MSPIRTSKSPSPTLSLPGMLHQIFEQNSDPDFVSAVNTAANIKLIMAINAGRLRVASQYLPEYTKYIPRMDLIDDPSSTQYSAVFEIPGINKDSISLGIRSGKLMIVGRRHAPYLRPVKLATASTVTTPEEEATNANPESNLRILAHELRYGNFERSINIPAGIKESHIKATLLDGMLTVTWPKSPPKPPLATDIALPAKSKSSSPSLHPQTMVVAGTASQ